MIKTNKIPYQNILFIMILSILSITFIWIFDFKNTQLLALGVLIINIYIVYKWRNNKYLLLLSLPMLYFTYGIVVGEYLAQNYQPVFNSLRSIDDGKYYDMAIVMLLLFWVIYVSFTKFTNNDIENKLEFRENDLIFGGIYIILLYICVFCINRVRGDSYSVQITTVYEYSYILFIFLILYSGSKKTKNILILILASIFIMQDFYYGGRITSIQILLVILAGLYRDKLNLRNMIMGLLIGVFVMSIISTYRNSYSLDNLSMTNIWKDLKDSLFVDATGVYAYGSSVTHIAGREYFSVSDKIKSLLGFIVNVFINSSSDLAKMGNVTNIVSPIYLNIGGGIIFSHFYFWLGWIGIILSGILTALIQNRLICGRTELANLMLIGFIATMPRWYLYTPLSLFRTVLFFIPIGYFLCCKAETVFKRY